MKEPSTPNDSFFYSWPRVSKCTVSAVSLKLLIRRASDSDRIASLIYVANIHIARV